ncbi:MAG: hypothetical protein ABJF10_22405 [Chthoniobacter sp.]|uniref:hypothetical protein n=1 Tax=Chthoniobacter sp. TaxID=2510640 RepID=UPI0032A6A4A7
MKTIFVLLILGILFGITACSSEPSTNPNPRRTFDAQSGNFEGPSPLPGNNGSGSRY